MLRRKILAPYSRTAYMANNKQPRHKLYSYLRAAGNFIPERWSEFKFSSQNYVEEFIAVMRFAESQITQSLNRSINQSISQSINHSIDLSTVIYNELFLVSLQTLKCPYLRSRYHRRNQLSKMSPLFGLKIVAREPPFCGKIIAIDFLKKNFIYPVPVW